MNVNDREWRILQDQLLAAQHAICAALGVVAAVLDEPTDPPTLVLQDPANCSHPPEFRRAAAAMGKPGQFFCLSCQTLQETP